MRVRTLRVSAIRAVAAVAVVGLWSPVALASDDPPVTYACPVQDVASCSDAEAWVIYMDGLSEEEKAIFVELADDLQAALAELEPSTTFADEALDLYQGFVGLMRVNLGEDITDDILSFEVMGALQAAETSTHAGAWVAAVGQLEISDVLSDFGSGDEPEPDRSVGRAMLTAGFAIVGAAMGVGGGPAGVAAGAAAGAAFGDALSDAVGIDTEDEGGGDAGEGGEGGSTGDGGGSSGGGSGGN